MGVEGFCGLLFVGEVEFEGWGFDEGWGLVGG